MTRVLVEDKPSWFAGHFPGDPILPGIAQLRMVTDLIGAASGQRARVTALNRVKFRKIIRPGDMLEIQARAGTGQNQYTFRITRDDEEVCSGMMHLAQQDEPAQHP